MPLNEKAALNFFRKSIGNKVNSQYESTSLKRKTTTLDKYLYKRIRTEDFNETNNLNYIEKIVHEKDNCTIDGIQLNSVDDKVNANDGSGSLEEKFTAQDRNKADGSSETNGIYKLNDSINNTTYETKLNSVDNIVNDNDQITSLKEKSLTSDEFMDKKNQSDDDSDKSNELDIKKKLNDSINSQDEIKLPIKSKHYLDDSSDDENDARLLNEAKSDENSRTIVESSENEDEIYGDVISFFNSAQLNELILIRGCSTSKAGEIISKRPYKTYKDILQAKISRTLVSGCEELFETRNNLTNLLQTCNEISQNLLRKIKPLLNNIDFNGTNDDLDFKIIAPPLPNKELQLKPYQLVGINWLRMLYEENLNAILADEMGLGKTVQAVVFLSYLYSIGITGPHIIIVPKSTISNWERELYKWCPEFKVIVYNGTQEERRQTRHKMRYNSDFNVFLGTYNSTISSKHDRFLIKKISFHYGIFDEAHMLKNMMSHRYQHFCTFDVQRKILLTGTPLQNNFVELISLLSFVMPDIFAHESNGLKKIFQLSQKSSDQSTKNTIIDERVQQIKNMLNPFCLRRIKSQVLTQLPKKVEKIERLQLQEQQKIVYNRLIEKARTEKANKDVPNLNLSFVMELRKASNHPLLIRSYYTDEILRKMSKDMLIDMDHVTSDPELIFEDFSVMSDFQIYKQCLIYPRAIGKYRLPIEEHLIQSNKLKYLDRVLPDLIEKGSKILIFSQFVIVLDIMELFLNQRNFRFLRLDGSTTTEDREQFIDQFNEDEDIKIFMLTTRAGGLGINLTSADVVIIHDLDYNPFNDRQAEDRCHRIGQTKDVKVIKLISENTIDELILQIATDKVELENVTYSKGDDNMIGDANDEQDEEQGSSEDEGRRKKNKQNLNLHVDMNLLLKKALKMV